MRGCGFHAASYDPHGIIQGYFQLLGMGASAVYWSGILCVAANNCMGYCLKGLLLINFSNAAPLAKLYLNQGIIQRFQVFTCQIHIDFCFLLVIPYL